MTCNRAMSNGTGSIPLTNVSLYNGCLEIHGTLYSLPLKGKGALELTV